MTLSLHCVYAYGQGSLLPETKNDGNPVVNLAYLELCDDEGHIHVSIADKHIEDATSVRIKTDWDRQNVSLIKTTNGWEIELYNVPVPEEDVAFDIEILGPSRRDGRFVNRKTANDIISVSKHLDAALADFQTNRSLDSISTYFCGKSISTVELLSFFQDFLELSESATCTLLTRYNRLITLENSLQISYLETHLLCKLFAEFLEEATGNEGNSCLCKVISTNRAAYFLDNPGAGFNADGCNDTPALKDCRQFEFSSNDDDLLVSYGRLGAAKSGTLAMQYDGCDDSPNDFSYRLRASGAAIAFRSVCIDPVTLSGTLTNCDGCIKEINLSYSYASEGEIYANAGNNLACTGESIELTAEDWAFLLITEDDLTTTIDTGGRKLYVNCGNDSPSLDSLITKGSDIISDLGGLLSDFSVGGLASSAVAVTGFIMNEVFVAPCQTLQIDNYNLLSGANKTYELAPGGYFEATMVSGVKFAGEAENVGKGYVTINGDFYMHAVLKTKVPENGVIPEYCSCEKIGAYVLGSLKEETPFSCDIQDNENNMPIDMNDIFIYSPRTIQQLQNLAGVKLGLEGPWDPKWSNNGGCCTTVNLDCLAECAYILEPCPSIQSRSVDAGKSAKGDNQGLHIYPNPTGNVLNISFINKFNCGEIEIFSATGESIIARKTTEEDSSIEINMEGVGKGLYIIIYKSIEGEVLTSKFIKL